MVNNVSQGLPELPAGLPQDSQHETAIWCIRRPAAAAWARAADADLDLDGPERRCFRCWSSPARGP